jgi:hypothetical protein
MKKCDDVFEAAQKFILNNKLKKDYDFLVVDFHGGITSEKMAMGHFFDGEATLVVGTHTHVPTSDHRVMEKGTASRWAMLSLNPAVEAFARLWVTISRILSFAIAPDAAM